MMASQEQQSPRRVTLMMDGDIVKKLTMIQAKLIKETVATVSFSKVVNMYVEEGLKKKETSNDSRTTWNHEGAKRLTVMLDAENDKKIKIRFGKHIVKCANEYCEMPSWSFSREINAIIRRALK